MTRQTNLLLVEDDSSVREALSKVLTSENYRVLGAATCREAILASEKNEIDLVLLDLNLGKESGWTAFHDLKVRQPDLPIIVTSAQRELLAHSSAAQANAVLEKPFDPPTLLELLKQASPSQTQTVRPTLERAPGYLSGTNTVAAPCCDTNASSVPMSLSA